MEHNHDMSFSHDGWSFGNFIDPTEERFFHEYKISPSAQGVFTAADGSTMFPSHCEDLNGPHNACLLRSSDENKLSPTFIGYRDNRPSVLSEDGRETRTSPPGFANACVEPTFTKQLQDLVEDGNYNVYPNFILQAGLDVSAMLKHSSADEENPQRLPKPDRERPVALKAETKSNCSKRDLAGYASSAKKKRVRVENPCMECTWDHKTCNTQRPCLRCSGKNRICIDRNFLHILKEGPTVTVPQLLDELPCEMIEMLISLSPQALDSHARRDYVAMDTVDLKISIETLNPTSEASNQVLEMTGQFSRSEPSHMGFFTSKPQKVSLIRYMAILAALEKNSLQYTESSFVADTDGVSIILSSCQRPTVPYSPNTTVLEEVMSNPEIKIQAFVQRQVEVQMFRGLQETIQRRCVSTDLGEIALDLLRAFIWVIYKGVEIQQSLSAFDDRANAFVERNSNLHTKLYTILKFIITKVTKDGQCEATFREPVARLGLTKYIGPTSLKELDHTENFQICQQAALDMIREEMDLQFGKEQTFVVKLEGKFQN